MVNLFYGAGWCRHQGSLFEDCCAATFCEPCMVCQLKREQDLVRHEPLPATTTTTTLGRHMEQRAQHYRY